MNSKKGQKAELRERYFNETGIYPLDNLNRYNHWLEDQIVDNMQCCKSDSEQLFCDCSQGKGLDIDEDGFLYCIDCQRNIAE